MTLETGEPPHLSGSLGGHVHKIKQCRRVATRYDKLAANYLTFVKLACIRLWLCVRVHGLGKNQH